MRKSNPRFSITEDEVLEARRRLRPVPEEQRRYSTRSNFGVPPERLGQWPPPAVPPRRQIVAPAQAQHEPLRASGSRTMPTPTMYPSGDETPRRLVQQTRRSLSNAEFNQPPLNSTNPFSPNFQPNQSEIMGAPHTSTPWNGSPSAYEPSPPAPFQYLSPSQSNYGGQPPSYPANFQGRTPPAQPTTNQANYQSRTPPAPPTMYQASAQNRTPPAQLPTYQAQPNPLQQFQGRYRIISNESPFTFPGKAHKSPPMVRSYQQAFDQDSELKASKRHNQMLSDVNGFFASQQSYAIPPMSLHQHTLYGALPQAAERRLTENQWFVPVTQQQQPQRQVRFENQLPRQQHYFRNGQQHQEQWQEPPRNFYQPQQQNANPFMDPMSRLLEQQHQQQKMILSRQGSSNKLPPFGGNPLDWPIFVQHYERSTRECQYTAAENCDRLEKALVGEAYKLVRPLLYSRDNPNYIMMELESRFGRPEFIINELIRKARATPAPKKENLNTILEFSSAINHLVITIESLNRPAYLFNLPLIQELVNKLPGSMKMQWGYHSMRTQNPTLRDFANWIKVAADAASLVSMPTFTDASSDSKDNRKGRQSPRNVSFSLTTAEEKTPEEKKEARPRPPCQDCGLSNHRLSQCRQFKKKTVDDRWEVVKTKKLCFQCLSPFHHLEKCNGDPCPIDDCNRRHHSLLHGSSIARKAQEQASENANSQGSRDLKQFNGNTNSPVTSTLLKIVPVKVSGRRGSKIINVVFDDASHVTLMDDSIADYIGAEGETEPLRLLWTNGHSQEDKTSKRCVIKIGPAHGTEMFEINNVRTVTTLNLPSQNIVYPSLVKEYPYLKGISFSYLPNDPPKMLIGEGHIHLTLPRDIRERGEAEPVASRTKLGWVVHGPQRRAKPNLELQTLIVNEEQDEILHKLVKENFTLESIGVRVSNDLRSREDILAEEKMKQVTRRIGNRFETGLLWRPDVPKKLPPSRDTAMRRLLSFERKMKREPELRQQMNDTISSYLKKGYVSKLSKEELQINAPNEWFLPLFATRHPNKPSKIRPIWDAAAKSHGKSLNDFLLTGENLMNDLPTILLKSRQGPIVVAGDIEEMFPQIRIREEDRPAQRFLHRESPDDEIDVLQVNALGYGQACGPYIAQFIRNLNAKEHALEFPDAANAIINLHFMDDYWDTKYSIPDAIKIIQDVKEVHSRGGFRIRKWMSNNKEVMEQIPEEERTTSMKNLAEWSSVPTERALGLHWDPIRDTYTFKVNLERAGTGIASGEVVPTKRAILRLVMLIWDPLGMLSHFTIKARILLQKVWRQKLGWDDPITEETRADWKRFINKLPEISSLNIQRCYAFFDLNASIKRELHVFADASESAYCAVSYLVTKENDKVISVAFVMGKSRVSPLKPKTIPRLELQAALIAARMRKYIFESLDLPIESCFLWSDSMTVLRWLRNDARRYQQFVSNRIGEIHEITDVTQWRWVPTQHNPADEGTRDGSCDLNSESRWFTGPDFLLQDESEWPREEIHEDENDNDEELRGEHVLVAVEPPSATSCLPNIERFSKYTRLVRASAAVLDAVKRFKRKPSPALPVVHAERLLILQSQWKWFPEEMETVTIRQPVSKKSRLFQLNPVRDAIGIMRMNSRLAHIEDEDMKNPIILHPKADLTRLLVLHIHEQFNHAGPSLTLNEVRQRYWIPTGKTAIKGILQTCGHCRISKAKIINPIMGVLPSIRTNQPPRPFTNVGVDYFGPFEATVKRTREKRYGVLFTCLSTRAVHVEKADKLDTDSCLLAIDRLIARRGRPQKLLSDNGTNFVGANRELKKCLDDLDQTHLEANCQVKGIQWTFSCARAPHMTGAIERLVGSVKRSLKGILHKRAPKDEVLQTLFTQAEAIVNSRPLTDVSSDAAFPEALTPFHFLIGTSSPLQAPGAFEDQEADLSRRWRQSQALTNMFWERWRKEYLPTLRKRTKWHETQPNIKIGEVVIVFDETLARQRSFPLGLITAIFPGDDDVVRVVEVKTSTGIYKRPTTRLGRLGICGYLEEETGVSGGSMSTANSP